MSLDIVFSQHTILRKRILESIKNLSHEQLHHIPTNFNNSIIWNAAHIVVTQELLTNGLCQIPLSVDDFWLTNFRKGSAGNAKLSQEQVEQLYELLPTSATTLEKRYRQGSFSSFSPYTTSFGVHLNTLDEALHFNLLHESLHLGYIMALKHLV